MNTREPQEKLNQKKKKRVPEEIILNRESFLKIENRFEIQERRKMIVTDLINVERNERISVCIYLIC
jgi:hypothetical protein